MSNQNWQCQEGDPFKPAQQEIDPRFATAHYGNDLKPTPDCGTCPGDGSICKTSCKVAEESPPVALIDIQARLRGTVDDDTPYFTCNAAKQDLLDAADRLDSLESEAEQLRMSVHNARIDAERYIAFRNAAIAEDTRFLDAMDDVIDRHTDDVVTIELFDAAIDAAMTKDAA